jgi:uncharacterized membrane protein YfcA
VGDLVVMAAVGFLAQLIDGALGMAYGVTCNSLLLAFGYQPARASATIHFAEILTSGISGHFHWKLGNVNRALFWNLATGGVVGGVLGALAISLAPAETLRPLIALYLSAMGVRILLHRPRPALAVQLSALRTRILGFFGGFLDASGGGGWGPIVVGTLLGVGHEPRTAIGSVNRAEFFVSVAASFTFILAIGFGDWQSIAALAFGGALAAPIGAQLASRIRRDWLLVMVGTLILLLSAYTLVVSLRG